MAVYNPERFMDDSAFVELYGKYIGIIRNFIPVERESDLYNMCNPGPPNDLDKEIPDWMLEH